MFEDVNECLQYKQKKTEPAYFLRLCIWKTYSLSLFFIEVEEIF